MSAQEREALIDALTMSPMSDHVGTSMASIERTADVLLAAGWSRPVSGGGEVEAATEEVIERVAESLAAEIHEAWEFQYDQCDHGTYRGGYLNGKPYAMCEITAERIVRRRAAAGLLAGGVPGREPTLHELVAETYEPEGVGIWWTNWAKAEPSKRRSMEAAVGYHGGVPGRSEAETKAEGEGE